MDRRTENRLIGALSAVVVAGLIVMTVGIAIALIRGHSGASQSLVAASPTATVDPKQAIVDRIQATHDAAVAEAFLHPELLPPRHPGFVATATPTPVPVPVGVPCMSEQLAGQQSGENGAGDLFMAISVANTSDHPCDLPVISDIEGIDTNGLSFVYGPVPSPSATCSPHLPFCIAQVPLPLQPDLQPANLRSAPSPGTAIVSLSYPFHCYPDDRQPTRPCIYVSLSKLILTFRGDVSVSITFSGRLPEILNSQLWVDTVALIGETHTPAPTVY